MELYMNRFHRMILVGFLMSFVLVNFETRARAQALEVVFKDSLWGAAIGSVVGLASWSLQDTDKDDKLFSKYILRGAAFGVFIGMAYGVYDVNSGGDAFMSQNHEEGLLHIDAERKQLVLQPLKGMPKLHMDEDQYGLKLDFLSASF